MSHSVLLQRLGLRAPRAPTLTRRPWRGPARSPRHAPRNLGLQTPNAQLRTSRGLPPLPRRAASGAQDDPRSCLGGLAGSPPRGRSGSVPGDSCSAAGGTASGPREAAGGSAPVASLFQLRAARAGEGWRPQRRAGHRLRTPRAQAAPRPPRGQRRLCLRGPSAPHGPGLTERGAPHREVALSPLPAPPQAGLRLAGAGGVLGGHSRAARRALPRQRAMAAWLRGAARAARLPKMACLSPASHCLRQPGFPQGLPVWAPPGTAPGIQRALRSQKAQGCRNVMDHGWRGGESVRLAPRKGGFVYLLNTHPQRPKPVPAHQTASASRPEWGTAEHSILQGHCFPLFLLRRLCTARWPSVL